jgi:hypothetical protein
VLSTPFAKPIVLITAELRRWPRGFVVAAIISVTYVAVLPLRHEVRMGLLVWGLVVLTIALARERWPQRTDSVRRIRWHPDSGWLLELDDGNQWPAKLGRRTRVCGRFVVLDIGNNEIGGISLLVTPGRIEHNAYRRLRIALRLGDG